MFVDEQDHGEIQSACEALAELSDPEENAIEAAAELCNSEEVIPAPHVVAVRPACPLVQYAESDDEAPSPTYEPATVDISDDEQDYIRPTIAFFGQPLDLPFLNSLNDDI